MRTKQQWNLRPFGAQNRKQDYALIHHLAHAAVPYDPDGNREWAERRRSFEATGRSRRHYVALHAGTHEPVAYAVLEQQWADLPGRFRLYLVFDPRRWTFSELGAFLYAHLLVDARELGATSLAATEYARDVAFITFLREQGFVDVGEGTYHDHAIVMMELRLAR